MIGLDTNILIRYLAQDDLPSLPRRPGYRTTLIEGNAWIHQSCDDGGDSLGA